CLARTGDAFRALGVAAAARGRSCHGRRRRDLGAYACGQSRRRLSSVARAGEEADRGEGTWLVPAADLASFRHAAQSAALFDGEGGHGDAGEGTGETLG